MFSTCAYGGHMPSGLSQEMCCPGQVTGRDVHKLQSHSGTAGFLPDQSCP